MMKLNWFRLIACIMGCELVGIVGSIFTMPSISTWYSTILKPWFVPPNWLFAPVWTLLFLLMGVALYLVLEKGFLLPDVRLAVSVFCVQLFLNILWSFLFFSSHNLFLAFVEILALELVILLNILLFYRISKPAAYVLMPYFVWVTFATFLTYNIWLLNP